MSCDYTVRLQMVKPKSMHTSASHSLIMKDHNAHSHILHSRGPPRHTHTHCPENCYKYQCFFFFFFWLFILLPSMLTDPSFFVSSQVAIIAGNFELAELIKNHKETDIGKWQN